MKKIFYLLFAAVCTSVTSYAAPGDTTWVQANIAQLSWNGNYDTTVAFPATGKLYRAVYMVFTLGKYQCPGSPTYCGDWDYTVQNYLITPGGKTFELGRLITPYANAGAPRTPWAWKQHYVFDVTDYVGLLHDSGKIRIAYSGYSGGFTGNIRFAFIEGVPDREVLEVRRLWNGSYGYGDTSHGGTRGINVHFQPVTDTAPSFARAAELKFTVTGHGSDNNYCNEFCPHNYYVYLNNEQIDSYTIWRSDCGRNELYPQSGTWIYERANWCPGSMVYSEHHKIPHIFGGMVSTLGLQFDPYAGSGGASYTTEATLFYYSGLKKLLDASIDQIIAPTNNENHFRENPICGSPVIHIKNHGANTIDSITFRYGLQGGTMQTMTWRGSLKTFDETDISLPELADLNKISGDTTKHIFTASIRTVNGDVDADTTNNSMSTQFVAAPLWPSSFRLYLRTNGAAVTSGASETSWQITDMNNNVVAARTNASINTLYADSVALPSGCYKLSIIDSGCDGLQWWANPGAGAGYMLLKKMNGTTIFMNGYNYAGQYNNDFGCGFTQYFYTLNPAGVSNISEGPLAMDAYPNPAQDLVNIDITGIQQINGTLRIIDALGRIVSEMPCNGGHQQLNTSTLTGGVYTILFVNEQGNKLQARLLITK
jgi:hypothetical protein